MSLRSVALLWLLAWGVGLGPASAEGPVRPGPERPGELRVPVLAEMRSLDPTRVETEVDATCVANVFDQLYQHHPWARPHRLMPCLASALPEISEDGTTLRIRLRRDATYVDDPCFPAGKGRRVTAHDVAFCLRRLMDPGTRSPSTYLLEGRIRDLDSFAAAMATRTADSRRASYDPAEGYPEVTGIVVEDESTLVLKLTARDADFVQVLASPALSIYPPEAVRHHGPQLRTHPVTSGPYTVVRLDSSRLELVRRSAWRDERAPVPEGDVAEPNWAALGGHDCRSTSASWSRRSRRTPRSSERSSRAGWIAPGCRATKPCGRQGTNPPSS